MPPCATIQQLYDTPPEVIAKLKSISPNLK